MSHGVPVRVRRVRVSYQRPPRKYSSIKRSRPPSGQSTTFRLSVAGKLVDTALTRGMAIRRAKEIGKKTLRDFVMRRL